MDTDIATKVAALNFTKFAFGIDTAFDPRLGVQRQLLPMRASCSYKDGARFEQSRHTFHPARF